MNQKIQLLGRLQSAETANKEKQKQLRIAKDYADLQSFVLKFNSTVIMNTTFQTYPDVRRLFGINEFESQFGWETGDSGQ